jgi:hypothetical protein
MSRLLAFGLGVLVGAGAVAYGPQLQRNLRPLIKQAVKAATQLAHGARVQGGSLVESLEDIYAEVIAEASAAMAAAPAKRKRPAAKARKHATRRRAAHAKPAEAAAANA